MVQYLSATTGRYTFPRRKYTYVERHSQEWCGKRLCCRCHWKDNGLEEKPDVQNIIGA